MLKDMRDFRERTHIHSLQKLEHKYQWQTSASAQNCLRFATSVLKHNHYNFKTVETDHGQIIAAKKGAGNRLGYIFTHIAIVMICIGGLLDGNVPLKIAQMRGSIQVEHRNIPASEVPAISTLSVNNFSFKATVSIPEGAQANLAFVDFKDGYLVQQLPFRIEVEDFRIEHYASGQPKSFASDLIIHDKDLDKPLRQIISVNHPLSHKGYTIYQSSFGDGGSRLNLSLWPLTGKDTSTLDIQTIVRTPYTVKTTGGNITLDISDFRPFNVNPDVAGIKKFRNLGPSFQFKLRNETGVATEYVNYMQPMEQNGALFYLSGVRHSPAENFKYWFVPADTGQRPDRFMNFMMALNNQDTLHEIAEKTARASDNIPAPGNKTVADFMVTISQQFLQSGIQGISTHIEKTAPEERRQEITELYATVLLHFFRNVYLTVLAKEGVDTDQEISDFDARFFDDAVTAMGVSSEYGSPVFIELNSFEHREATGLQITRSPGKWLVFPGCLFLVIGVFCMFYLPQRRIWIVFNKKGTNSEVLLVGSAQRNIYDFDREFEKLHNELGRQPG
jgi:cytochrome c biogenesis protein